MVQYNIWQFHSSAYGKTIRGNVSVAIFIRCIRKIFCLQRADLRSPLPRGNCRIPVEFSPNFYRLSQPAPSFSYSYMYTASSLSFNQN